MAMSAFVSPVGSAAPNSVQSGRKKSTSQAHPGKGQMQKIQEVFDEDNSCVADRHSASDGSLELDSHPKLGAIHSQHSTSPPNNGMHAPVTSHHYGMMNSPKTTKCDFNQVFNFPNINGRVGSFQNVANTVAQVLQGRTTQLMPTTYNGHATTPNNLPQTAQAPPLHNGFAHQQPRLLNSPPLHVNNQIQQTQLVQQNQHGLPHMYPRSNCSPPATHVVKNNQILNQAIGMSQPMSHCQPRLMQPMSQQQVELQRERRIRKWIDLTLENQNFLSQLDEHQRFRFICELSIRALQETH
jgi:hypothetical protein